MLFKRIAIDDKTPWETIQFLHFNFDGKGGAVARFNGGFVAAMPLEAVEHVLNAFAKGGRSYFCPKYERPAAFLRPARKAKPKAKAKAKAKAKVA